MGCESFQSHLPRKRWDGKNFDHTYPGGIELWLKPGPGPGQGTSLKLAGGRRGLGQTGAGARAGPGPGAGRPVHDSEGSGCGRGYPPLSGRRAHWASVKSPEAGPRLIVDVFTRQPLHWNRTEENTGTPAPIRSVAPSSYAESGILGTVSPRQRRT